MMAGNLPPLSAIKFILKLYSLLQLYQQQIVLFDAVANCCLNAAPVHWRELISSLASSSFSFTFLFLFCVQHTFKEIQ